MKTITHVLVVMATVLLFPMTMQAQNRYMYINKTDGTVLRILCSEVINITFGTEDAPSSSMSLQFEELTNTGSAEATLNFPDSDYESVVAAIEDIGFCFYPDSEGEEPLFWNNPCDCRSSITKGGDTWLTFSGKVNGHIGGTFSVRAFVTIGGQTYYSGVRHYTAEESQEEEERIDFGVLSKGNGTGIVTLAVNAHINRDVLPSAIYMEYGTEPGTYTTSLDCTSEALVGDGVFNYSLTLTPSTTYYVRCYCVFSDGSPSLYSSEITVTPSVAKANKYIVWGLR